MQSPSGLKLCEWSAKILIEKSHFSGARIFHFPYRSVSNRILKIHVCKLQDGGSAVFAKSLELVYIPKTNEIDRLESSKGNLSKQTVYFNDFPAGLTKNVRFIFNPD